MKAPLKILDNIDICSKLHIRYIFNILYRQHEQAFRCICHSHNLSLPLSLQKLSDRDLSAHAVYPSTSVNAVSFHLKYMSKQHQHHTSQSAVRPTASAIFSSVTPFYSEVQSSLTGAYLRLTSRSNSWCTIIH